MLLQLLRLWLVLDPRAGWREYSWWLIVGHDHPNARNNRNTKREPPRQWVSILVRHATQSEIVVHDPLCQQLVEWGQVGLGQLFRFLDLLPTFWLHDAAPKVREGFWRDYTLECPELSCRIHEHFVANMWELRPLDAEEDVDSNTRRLGD